MGIEIFLCTVFFHFILCCRQVLQDLVKIGYDSSNDWWTTFYTQLSKHWGMSLMGIEIMTFF